jgi:glycerophosphoryl diester phosphodiesterase
MVDFQYCQPANISVTSLPDLWLSLIVRETLLIDDHQGEPEMPASNEPFHIIGHRGAAGERLENSLDGFRHALTLEIAAIELDIREHSSQLWVFHDHDLKRLTSTTGLFDDRADIPSIRLSNGEPIPSLQQVLDLYWGRMPVNIEIKAVSDLGLLLDLLAGYGQLPAAPGLPWILISSFDHQVLLRLKQLGCQWPLAPISSGIPLQLDAELEQLTPWSWHFDNEYLDLEQVRKLRARGVASLVYTVNDPLRARFLRQNGVAGIFTDVPGEMLKLE